MTQRLAPLIADFDYFAQALRTRLIDNPAFYPSRKNGSLCGPSINDTHPWRKDFVEGPLKQASTEMRALLRGIAQTVLQVAPKSKTDGLWQENRSETPSAAAINALKDIDTRIKDVLEDHSQNPFLTRVGKAKPIKTGPSGGATLPYILGPFRLEVERILEDVAATKRFCLGVCEDPDAYLDNLENRRTDNLNALFSSGEFEGSLDLRIPPTTVGNIKVFQFVQTIGEQINDLMVSVRFHEGRSEIANVRCAAIESAPEVSTQEQECDPQL